MKRLICTLTIAVATLGLPATAQATYPSQGNFGVNGFDVGFRNDDGTAATQAGSHPYAMDLRLATNVDGEGAPEGWFRDLKIHMSPGFIGDPSAYPRCGTLDFLAVSGVTGINLCPRETTIGITGTAISEKGTNWFSAPLFNLTPPPGVLLRMGFRAVLLNIVIDVALTDEAPHHPVAILRNTPQVADFHANKVELWGDPSDPVHDELRGECGSRTEIGLPPGDLDAFQFENGNGKTCPVEPNPKPLLTLPTRCEVVSVDYEALSWEGETDSGGVLIDDAAGNPQPLTGCGKVGLKPAVASKPTSESAETGSGLDFSISFEDEGLTSVEGIAQSHVKEARILFPEGLTINPSVGEGLQVCTPAQLARETLASQPGEGCPNASKLGTVSTTSSLIEEAVEGSIFLAQQDDPKTTAPGAENPFDTLIALYMVLKNPKLGILLKLPVKVEPDPRTGRLVASLKDSPQVPFDRFHARLRTGARAALVTPPACGTYTTQTVLTPWANPGSPVTVPSTFKVTSGVHGGPCPPAGVPPFDPAYQAGSINNNAASHTPFHMRLIRADGEQNMTKFSSILPPGVLGSLVGVAKCPEAAIVAARQKSGRDEIASPSCPASSLIGHSLAGAGVGDALTYVGGQIYLAGPFRGAPLSVVSVTPAVAGPFDADTVVVRLGLTLNPKTAEVEVDGSASEPIPHILKGIVLKVRDLRVYVDRPNFIVNPTSCDPSRARAVLYGSYLNVFDPADDVPVDLATRFQAANCLNLGFKPKLGLKLKGGTRRGGHPGLKATYRPRPGDANVEGLVVRLPSSAFLDQAHIRTICTRVQFAADACPKGARYGFIEATTPLLEEPLKGPVWLRSSDHKLPDLVFDLHGIVDIEVPVRIDSIKGGIRSTLGDLPDAPLSKVILRMQGGRKGLIVNSRNICRGANRARVKYSGQNGKLHRAKPRMRGQCRKAKRKKEKRGR